MLESKKSPRSLNRLRRGGVQIRLLLILLIVISSLVTTAASELLGSSTHAGAATVQSRWAAESSIPSNLPEAYMEGTSCAGPTFCKAVGYAIGSGGTGLVLSWNGSSWSTDTLPSGTTTLISVSCPSTSFCMAVGTGTISGVAGNIAIEWTSSSGWSLLGSRPGGASSVSCLSASFCLAVGDVYPNSSAPAASAWNSTTWAPTNAMAQVQGSTSTTVSGVSCTTTSFCMAVGYYLNSSGVDQALAEQWSGNGSQWSLQSVPDATYPNEPDNNFLSAISCVGTSFCMTVGNDSYYSLEDQPLREEWNGSQWSIVPGPTYPAQGETQALTGVSCTSSSYCASTGQFSYVYTGWVSALIVEEWNGETWNTSYFGSGYNRGNPSVSCFAATFCQLASSDGSNDPPYSTYPQMFSSYSAAIFDGLILNGSAIGNDAWGGPGGADTSCTCSAGDPVNLATGDYYDAQTDLTIPGAGIPLTFNRTYDAAAARAEATANPPQSGPIGFGWTDNLNMSVTTATVNNNPIATVTQANGSQLTFQYYAQNAGEPTGTGGKTWCPSDASAGVWCPTAPRFIATLANSAGESGGTWTFTNNRQSPITYSFNSGGALTQITDKNGDALKGVAYSPGTGQVACPGADTCTAWESIPAGESSPAATLVEAFNVTQLASVFDAASSTQEATFGYSGTGCSSDLCSVSDPGSLSTTFQYDGQYDLTTISGPAAGQVTTNTYSSGQITEQVIATGGTNQELAFAYSTIAPNVTQTQVTSYPDGSGGNSTTETYLFSNNVEVGVTDGSGVTSSVIPDPDTLLPSVSTNGDFHSSDQTFANYGSGGTASSSGDVTQATDGDGNTTETQYTASNLPWCSVDAADYANGTRCPGTEPTSPPSPGTYIGYTLNIYNSSNQLTSTTDPLGNTTVNAYTPGSTSVPGGLVYCSIDPANYAKGSVICPSSPPTTPPTTAVGYTTTIYNANGYRTSTTNPDGDTTSYVYGSAANPGLPTVTTDPDGKVTTDTYNAEGEVTSQVVTDPSPNTYTATTQDAYDSAGRKWCEVDPLEYSLGIRCPATAPTSPPTGTPGYTDTIYNADGQVTSTTNPIGGTTQYAYDGSGNKYCTVTPNNYSGRDAVPGRGIHRTDADQRSISRRHPRRLRRRQPGRPRDQSARWSNPDHLRRCGQRSHEDRRVEQLDQRTKCRHHICV